MFLESLPHNQLHIKNEGNDTTVREDEVFHWFSKKENTNLTGYQKRPFGFIQQGRTYGERYIDFRK